MRQGRNLMDESIRDPMPRLCGKLVDEYGEVVSRETIAETAEQALGEFEEARVREFVPVFAWRRARARLRQALSDGSEVEQPEWSVPSWMVAEVELDPRLLRDEEEQRRAEVYPEREASDLKLLV